MNNTVEDYVTHPSWSGKIHIPFIRQTIQTEVIDGILTFSHHGVNYSIPLNHQVKAQSDGSIIVAMGRKNKYRTVRKPIGLPSHASIYFVTNKNQSITPHDVHLYKVWKHNVPQTTMKKAMQAALA